MPITNQKRPTRGSKMDQLMSKVREYPRTKTKAMKKQFYDFLHVSATGFQNFYDEGDLAVDAANSLNVILSQCVIDTNPEWHKYSREFKKWSDKYESPGAENHPHHSEYSNIATQLRIIYEALLQMEDDAVYIWGQTNNKNEMDEYGQGKVPDKVKGDYYDNSKLIQFEGPLGKSLTVTIEKFRKLYIVAIAISRKTDVTKTLTAEDINEITNDFLKLEQADWDFIKNKHIDVIDGKDVMDFTIVSAETNAILADVERKLGSQAQSIVGDYRTGFQDNFGKVFQNVDFSKLEGSKTIRNEIAQQLSDRLVKGKHSKYKKKTNKKNTIGKVGGKKLPTVKTKSLKAKPIPRPSGRRNETGAPEELIKLRAAINKRLPAEVRRNMGKPALTNRSGTFSNSVSLDRLTRTPRGIAGDYSYLTSPYETFENSGKRRWPTGYNPKPLITKSIRNLALVYTSEKFTYLRRK